MAHCRMLRRSFGDDIAVVFFGPCIAKKNEADRHPDLLDMALTFLDLRAWLDECQETGGLSASGTPTAGGGGRRGSGGGSSGGDGRGRRRRGDG